MKYSKEEVLIAISEKMTHRFGLTCPPKVKMNSDGSVEIDMTKKHNEKLIIKP